MSDALSILQPVFAMGILTLIMTIWMFFTRIPAMSRLKVNPQEGQDTSELRKKLPHSVNSVSNNYNHLFEQPVLFYAVCISVAVLDLSTDFLVNCAWVYVALRVLHSLVQATVDIVLIRFYLFLASWAALATLLINVSLSVF